MGLADFSLVENSTLRRATVRIARDLNVQIALVDGFFVNPNRSVAQYRRSLDAVADLGCRRINGLSFDPSWERTLEETGALAVLAAEYGLTLTVETCPLFTIDRFDKALRLIQILDMPNVKLLIDTLHLTRGGELAALDQIDPNLIDYVQICDGLLAHPGRDAYLHEAGYERLLPGEGEIPLRDILRGIPSDVIVGAEIPRISLREAGVDDLDQAREIVAAIRRILVGI
jgi:sugar phosphate isomerase/epimerase